MKVAIDLHGTIDKYPESFSRIIENFNSDKDEVYILSGPPKKQIKKELKQLKRKYYKKIKKNIKGIISVVDWLKTQDVEMWQDEKGDWWTSEENWWSSKGKICKEYSIELVFDDKEKYKEQIIKNGGSFVHII